MAKSLHCPSETLTILLIDYIPIQKVKKSFKRARSQPFPLFATSSYERSVFKCLPTERTFLKSWQNGAGRGGRAPCSTQKQQNGLPLLHGRAPRTQRAGIRLEWGSPLPQKVKGDGTLQHFQALILNVTYQPPHYLSPTRALMLQLTRSQLILRSLQFRLMSVWWDLGMVNHLPGTWILSSFNLRKIYLLPYLEVWHRRPLSAHLVCYSTETVLLLCGILAYYKIVASTQILLKKQAGLILACTYSPLIKYLQNEQI